MQFLTMCICPPCVELLYIQTAWSMSISRPSWLAMYRRALVSYPRHGTYYARPTLDEGRPWSRFRRVSPLPSHLFCTRTLNLCTLHFALLRSCTPLLPAFVTRSRLFSPASPMSLLFASGQPTFSPPTQPAQSLVSPCQFCTLLQLGDCCASYFHILLSL